MPSETVNLGTIRPPIDEDAYRAGWQAETIKTALSRLGEIVDDYLGDGEMYASRTKYLRRAVEAVMESLASDSDRLEAALGG